MCLTSTFAVNADEVVSSYRCKVADLDQGNVGEIIRITNDVNVGLRLLYLIIVSWQPIIIINN